MCDDYLSSLVRRVEVRYPVEEGDSSSSRKLIEGNSSLVLLIVWFAYLVEIPTVPVPPE